MQGPHRHQPVELCGGCRCAWHGARSKRSLSGCRLQFVSKLSDYTASHSWCSIPAQVSEVWLNYRREDHPGLVPHDSKCAGRLDTWDEENENTTLSSVTPVLSTFIDISDGRQRFTGGHLDSQLCWVENCVWSTKGICIISISSIHTGQLHHCDAQFWQPKASPGWRRSSCQMQWCLISDKCAKDYLSQRLCRLRIRNREYQADW